MTFRKEGDWYGNPVMPEEPEKVVGQLTVEQLEVQQSSPPIFYETIINWNYDTSILSYKDGIMTIPYQPFNPDLFAAWAEEHEWVRVFAPDNLLHFKQNYLVQMALQFGQLNWIEQLGITAREVIKYFDRQVFRQMNGMTPRQAWERFTLFNIQPGTQLQINDVKYVSFQPISMLAGAYIPQNLGEFYNDLFEMNTIYTIVAILTAPKFIEALPEGFEFLKEAIPELGKFLKMVQDKARSYMGENLKLGFGNE